MDPRHWLLTKMFESSHAPYAALSKSKPAWGITATELTRMRAGSLGETMGHYLLERDFELIPKLESHDFCHLLSDTPTDVVSEIALQAVLFGNGKRSLYLLGALALGLVLFPEQLLHFIASYRKGQQMVRFYDLDFHGMLGMPFAKVQSYLAGEIPRAALESTGRIEIGALRILALAA